MTFVVAVLVLLLAIAWAHPLPWRGKLAAEGLVYLLLVLACASWPPLRRVVARLGWPRQAVLGLMFVVATGAQLLKSNGPAYPFVMWTMYSAVEPSTEFARIDASLASGRTIHLPFAELTPSRSPRALLSRFRRELRSTRRAAEADPERAAESMRELERILSSLAHTYNQRNPADPIRSIRAGLCTVAIREYRGPESVRCDHLLSFALPPERQP